MSEVNSSSVLAMAAAAVDPSFSTADSQRETARANTRTHSSPAATGRSMVPPSASINQRNSGKIFYALIQISAFCTSTAAVYDSPLLYLMIAPAPVPISHQQRKDSKWEILSTLEQGNTKPKTFEGFLAKRRKWPLKGWHKRYYLLEKGVLSWGKVKLPTHQTFERSTKDL